MRQAVRTARCGVSRDPATAPDSAVTEAFHTREAVITEATHTAQASANEEARTGPVVFAEAASNLQPPLLRQAVPWKLESAMIAAFRNLEAAFTEAGSPYGEVWNIGRPRDLERVHRY